MRDAVALGPSAVAQALWRLAYGADDAQERRFQQPGHRQATAFLVDLVEQVERRLLEGCGEDPWVAARRVVAERLPTEGFAQDVLCEQLGIAPFGLAGPRLSFLARDLCSSLAERLNAILATSYPRDPAVDAVAGDREYPYPEALTSLAVDPAEPPAIAVSRPGPDRDRAGRRTAGLVAMGIVALVIMRSRARRPA